MWRPEKWFGGRIVIWEKICFRSRRSWMLKKRLRGLFQSFSSSWKRLTKVNPEIFHWLCGFCQAATTLEAGWPRSWLFRVAWELAPPPMTVCFFSPREVHEAERKGLKKRSLTQHNCKWVTVGWDVFLLQVEPGKPGAEVSKKTTISPIECGQGDQPLRCRCPDRVFWVNEPSAVPWWWCGDLLMWLVAGWDGVMWLVVRWREVRLCG